VGFWYGHQIKYIVWKKVFATEEKPISRKTEKKPFDQAACLSGQNVPLMNARAPATSVTTLDCPYTSSSSKNLGQNMLKSNSCNCSCAFVTIIVIITIRLPSYALWFCIGTTYITAEECLSVLKKYTFLSKKKKHYP